MAELFSFRNMPKAHCLPPHAIAFGLALVLGLANMHQPGFAQHLDKAKYLKPRLAKAAQNTPLVAGNDFYEIVMERFVGAGVGLFSVRTGSRHPVTIADPGNPKPQDLLTGASDSLAGSSYTTIRSYRSQTDYVQTQFPDSANGFRVFWLDHSFISDDSVVADTNFIKPIISDRGTITGFRVTYHLPGLPQPDGIIITDTLAITEILNAHGESFADAWVEVTTIVKNTGTQPTTLGIRYLWDLNIGGDDGPVLRQRGGDPFGPNEMSQVPVDFAYYVAEANDTLRNTDGSIKVLPPAYNFFGSAITPATLKRTGLQPERMQQVFWPLAFFNAFDYQTDDSLRVVGGLNDPLSRLTGGDNAIQYFWGESPNRALTLWPGQSAEFTQGLFGSLPNAEPSTVVDWIPPMCEIVAVHPGPPKRLEIMVQDFESGVRSIRVRDENNVRVDIPDFELGTTEHLHIQATALDPTQPFSLTIAVRDLVGNVSTCDPILLTLQPDLNITEYRLAPAAVDRYFYINNQGVEQIEVELNAYHFILRTSNAFGKDVFKMPAQGDMSIDIANSLKPEHNAMVLRFAGPPGSRADVILADMNMKPEVDLVLGDGPVPREFTLAQNLPNPFHGRTTIRFELPPGLSEKRHVKLAIYNMLGQSVRTLVDMDLPTTSHQMEWDGRDELGRDVAAGVYFYRLTSGELHLTRKMVLLQ
ncbi:MAG: T9SS type A sorting domain-containing protein [bacterium]